MLRAIPINVCRIGLVIFLVHTEVAMAKGLNTLSEANPAHEKGNSTQGGAPSESISKPGQEQSDKGVQGSPTEQSANQKLVASPPEKSDLSKKLSEKLNVGVSYGWVWGSKISGNWTARGGMSDISLAYLLRDWGELGKGFLSYRYAPLSVTGTEDSQSYRGVWEIHYAGIKFIRHLNHILPFGTFELGYVSTNVQAVDGLQEKSVVERGGISAVLGGGVEYKLSDGLVLAPKVNIGVGTVRLVQIAAAAHYVF